MFKGLAIRHFHISDNKLCLLFLLGIRVVPREIKDNAYAKFWGANKVYFGRCANGPLSLAMSSSMGRILVILVILYHLLRLKKAREKKKKRR